MVSFVMFVWVSCIVWCVMVFVFIFFEFFLKKYMVGI